MTQLSLTEATQFMNELFAIWTETDHASRRAAIEAHYHPDIHFNDPDGEFIGYQALEGFSDSLQQRFPGDRFELVGQPETVGNALRASWQFGPFTGTDFALLDQGKVGV